jgi:hypothetical protein
MIVYPDVLFERPESGGFRLAAERRLECAPGDTVHCGGGPTAKKRAEAVT